MTKGNIKKRERGEPLKYKEKQRLNNNVPYAYYSEKDKKYYKRNGEEASQKELQNFYYRFKAKKEKELKKKGLYDIVKIEQYCIKKEREEKPLQKIMSKKVV